jgi:hypothetical protein
MERSVKSKQPGAPGGDARVSERWRSPDRNVSIQPSLDEAGDEGTDFVAETRNAAASLSDDLKAAATTMTRAAKDQAADFASGVGQELSKTAESQKAKV